MANRRNQLTSQLDPVAANAAGVFYSANLLTQGYSIGYISEQLGIAGFAAGAIAAIASAAEQAASFAGPAIPGSFSFPGFNQIPITPGSGGGTITVAITAYLPCMYVSPRGGRTTQIVRWVDETYETSYPPDLNLIILELCSFCSPPHEECDPAGVQIEIAYIVRS